MFRWLLLVGIDNTPEATVSTSNSSKILLILFIILFLTIISGIAYILYLQNKIDDLSNELNKFKAQDQINTTENEKSDE